MGWLTTYSEDESLVCILGAQILAIGMLALLRHRSERLISEQADWL